MRGLKGPPPAPGGMDQILFEIQFYDRMDSIQKFNLTIRYD